MPSSVKSCVNILLTFLTALILRIVTNLFKESLLLSRIICNKATPLELAEPSHWIARADLYLPNHLKPIHAPHDREPDNLLDAGIGKQELLGDLVESGAGTDRVIDQQEFFATGR